MTRDDLLTYDGITQSIVEWALDYGITPVTIMLRLKQGMNVVTAITKPMPARPGDQLPEPNYGPETLTHEGRTQTLSQWSDETGLRAGIIRSRIRMGWTAQRTLTEPLWRHRGVRSVLPDGQGTGGGSSVRERGKLESSQNGVPQ